MKTAYRALSACLFGLILPALATSAVAETYVGAGAGMGNYRDACDSFSDFVSGIGAGGSCDDEVFAIKLFAGMTFNEFIYVESYYQYLDEADQSVYYGSDRVSLTYSGHLLGAVVGLRKDFGKVAIYANGGVAFYSANLDGNGDIGSNHLSIDETDTGTSPALGVGLDFELTKQVTMRYAFDYIYDVGDADSFGESDVTSLTVGIRYGF